MKKRAKFAELMPGLHENTFVGRSSKQGDWESWQRFDVIYVNKEAREVVIRAFSSLHVLSADQFDTQGFEKEPSDE